MFQQWQRYSVYKDSGIEWLGQIPEHWVVIKLSYCFKNIGSGTTPTSANPKYYFNGKYNWLQTGDLNDSEIYKTSKKITQSALEDFSSLRFFPTGSIVIAMYGATIGKTGLLKIKTTTNQACCVLAESINLVDKYVFYWLNSVKKHLISLSYGGGQPNINQEMIRGMKIQLPPLQEQEAIASFLDRETAKIDTSIQKKKRLIELLREKRTAIINQAVTKGLNPDVTMKDSGIEWLGEIPEHWGVKRLKFILAEPLKYGANESAQLNDRDCPRFIRITDIAEDGSLREDTFKSLPEDIAKPFILKIGDLLFARSGTVGKTFMYREYWGRACYAGYLIRARFNLDKAVPEFISYFGNSSVYWNWISSIFIQATIKNVSAEKYANLFLSLPLVEEQEAIARFLDRETTKIDTVISKTRTSIEKLQEYRTALISAAVTGKIDVRNNP